MKRRTIVLFTTLAMSIMAGSAGALVTDKKALTIEGAKKILAAAEAEAKKMSFPASIAVVDDGGNLMMLERLDGIQVASANVAVGKARTSAIFKRPTSTFEDIIKNGRTAMVALADFTPLQGGVPILYQGEVIGAIGVSGNSPAIDEQIAKAGAEVIAKLSAAAAK